MIINLRGCSGSGKTTIVRALLAGIGGAEPDVPAGARKPEGYYLPAANLYVVGSYESVCGGCDTLKTTGDAERIVRAAHAAGRHVLFEGAMLSTFYGCWVRLGMEPGVDMRFITLNTPLDVCLGRVATRRAERGDTRPFNPANTTRHHNTVMTNHASLVKSGRPHVYLLSAEEAERTVRGWLAPPRPLTLYERYVRSRA